MSKDRIALVGFMGSGKTLVANELAMMRNERWVDLDSRIAIGQGRSPAQIIFAEGEAVFREMETTELQKVLSESVDDIIALGGGAWIIERNRELLRAHDAITVWLDAPFDLCWKRIEAADESRPLAATREAAQKLYGARRDVYSLANVRVQVGGEAPHEIAEMIASLLQQQFDM
jgi:shikimate kinase